MTDFFDFILTLGSFLTWLLRTLLLLTAVTFLKELTVLLHNLNKEEER